MAVELGGGRTAVKTTMLLMTRYDSLAVIPADRVCQDFFTHLTTEQFIRKVGSGDIALPLVRIEASQKCAKGVHLQDLADYIDAQRAKAQKELRQMVSA